MNTLLSRCALSACLLLQGCMTYSHNTLAPLNTPEHDAPKSPSVSLSLHTHYYYNDAEKPNLANSLQVEKPLLTALQRSGQFDEVRLGTGGERHLIAHVTNYENGNLLIAAISGFSLLLIPNKAGNTLALEMIVQDANGTELGRVRSQEQFTTWFHLALIPGVFFSPSFNNIFAHLVGDNLQQARQQGLL